MRPETAVFDDGFARARRILQHRIDIAPKMRVPGANPKGEGIGIKIDDLPHMGRAYVNQYITTSLKVLAEYDRRRRNRRQRMIDNLPACEPQPTRDIFDRAEMTDIKKTPLLSQLDNHRRDKPPLPNRVKSRLEMRGRDRESASAETLLRSRLNALRRVARNDPVLAALRFCHERIDDDWAVTIAEAIGLNFQLLSLALVGNDITNVGAEHVARAVADHPTLETLAFGGNRVGDKGAFAFARTLEASESLQVLNLTAPKYHYKYYRDRRTKDFQENTVAIRVDDEETFDPATWSRFEDPDDVDPTAERIGPKGVRALARSLGTSRLIELDLGGQGAGDDGAKALAAALIPLTPPATDELPSLQFLGLEANGIRDSGVVDLCSVLFSAKSRLRSLRLAMNLATDKSATAITAFDVPAAKACLHLDVSLNHIGTEGCSKLLRAAPIVAYHTNPGYVEPTMPPCPSREPLHQSPTLENDDKIRPVGLPLRLGETAHTDCYRNLMHLRVSTPQLRKKLRSAGTVEWSNSESFLKVAARAATARSERELLGLTATFRRDKRALVQREQLTQFQAAAGLPPFSFNRTLKRNAARAVYAAGEKTARTLANTTEPPPHREPPRVHTMLNQTFSRVLSSPGAPYGRLDGLDTLRSSSPTTQRTSP
ncbi:hypothetical protein CTAYLR_004404 [Chrysophaeum taylorii]|uniref:Uncharacterized protein n=1 Tax=Chrysophaeum taylorii TaxID=2483200 RepID=A0AAD7UMJ9_9STRA|nr:hypothetical protein CTAYLR_004404 [Chrysophaeum taylorii]